MPADKPKIDDEMQMYNLLEDRFCFGLFAVWGADKAEKDLHKINH